MPHLNEPWRSVLVVYGWIVVVASMLAFVMMAVDKLAAGRGWRRVPERFLHRLELLGGWPGSWLATRLFRHKSRKRSYRRVFWLVVATHVAGLTLVLWLGLQG